MTGRFPLYTDADVYGPLILALRRRGWDLVGAIDVYPPGTADAAHFERAARDSDAFVLFDQRGDAFGELDAAPLDADQQEIVGTVRQLEDLDGHTLQRPRHRAGVKDLGSDLGAQGTQEYTGVRGGLPPSTACTLATAIAAI